MLPYFSKKWTEFKKCWLTKEKTKHLSCRILCVDDDIDFCKYVEKLAAPLGIECENVFSMEGAKQKIEEFSSYSAFIIDGHLPDGSGLELVAWIREKKGLNTPIGFLSRVYHDAASFRILKESLRVDYVLDKPIKPNDMGRLLSQLCSINRELLADEPFSEYLLAEVKANYQKTIFDKVERLERMIQLVQKNPSQKNLQNLRTEIHKLAGSSGSYGYTNVSRLCKSLEQELINQIEQVKEKEPDSTWLNSLDNFFRELKMNFQISQPEEHVPELFPSPPFGSTLSLYIVDDGVALTDSIKNVLKEKLEFYVESNPEIALKKLTSTEFNSQVVLINENFSLYPNLSSYSLIEAFYNNKKNLFTVMGLTNELQNWQALAKIIKRGLPYALVKPLSESIVDFLLQESISIGTRYKILIVDDDSDTIQYITQSLKYFGMEVKTLSDPLLLQETLMNYYPDILLVDVDFSDEKKADIFRSLQRMQYRKLLVAMVTISQESNLIKMIYGSEVDDILFKPLESSILQKRILNLLKKINVKEDKNIDLNNGLLNVQAFHEYVNSLVSKSVNKSFEILVLFEIDHYLTQVKQIGQLDFEKIISEINCLINQTLRLEKYACYLGKGRFALLFSGYDLHYLRILMQTFLEGLNKKFAGEVSLKFHCGISSSLIGGQAIEQFEKAFHKGNESQVDVVIVDHINIQNDQLKAFIFESNFRELDNLIQIFQNVGLVAFLNKGLEEVVSGLRLEIGTILVLAGTLRDRQGELRKLLLEKNIKMPVVYMPTLEKETLASLLREGLDYTENPFNLMLIIEQ